MGPLGNGDGFFVEDGAPGVPAVDRGRVFEHGYTTHETGTGDGLSSVRSIGGARGQTSR